MCIIQYKTEADRLTMSSDKQWLHYIKLFKAAPSSFKHLTQDMFTKEIDRINVFQIFNVSSSK